MIISDHSMSVDHQDDNHDIDMEQAVDEFERGN
jgi:hypothetical protein